MRKLLAYLSCLVIAACIAIAIGSTAWAAPTSPMLTLPDLQSLGGLSVEPVHCRLRRHCHRYCSRVRGQRRCRTYCHRCRKIRR